MLRRRPALVRALFVRAVAIGVLTATVAAHASAEIVFIEQLRRVQAIAGASDGTESDLDVDADSNTETGPLVQSVDAEVHVGEVISRAQSGQTTEISGNLLLVSADIDAEVAADPSIPESGGEVGVDASLQSRFELTEPTEYTLSGGITTEGEATAGILLQGPEGIVEQIHQSEPGSQAVGRSGVLMPGVYMYDVVTGQVMSDTGGLAEPRFARAHVYVGLLFQRVVAVPGTDGGPLGVRVFPNPAVAGAPVALEVAGEGEATIRVVDVNGRLIDRLVRPNGPGTIRWDATSRDGRPLPAGVYFVEVDGGAGRTVERLTLLER
jgi:hypothetical protein